MWLVTSSLLLSFEANYSAPAHLRLVRLAGNGTMAGSFISPAPIVHLVDALGRRVYQHLGARRAMGTIVPQL